MAVKKSIRMNKMAQINLILFSIIFFISMIIIAHFFTPPEYYWTQNTISDLAAQNYNNAWIMRLGFIGFGLLLNAGIVLRFIKIKKISYPDILIMIYGTSVLLSGFFSAAPFDGSTNYSIIQDRLHSLFAQIAGFALSFGILGYLISSSNAQEKLFHLAFLILVIGFSIFFGLSESGIVGIGKGIIQRTLYMISFTWMWIVYFQSAKQAR